MRLQKGEKEKQGVTEGSKGLSSGYRRLNGVTRGYRGSQVVTWGSKTIQKVSAG